MTDKQPYQPTAPIVHGLSNEDYRSAPGDSATFLKDVCSKSVKHAKTPRKKTKALNTGLALHEFILERHSFEKNYSCGPNPEDYPDVITSAEDMRAVIDELNKGRKPKLKTTGSKPALLGEIANDDPEHLRNVGDPSSLSADELKDKIKFINEQPCRGLLAKSGTISEMSARAQEAGWGGQCWGDVVASHKPSDDAVTMLDYEEHTKYDDMYKSLLEHLRAAPEGEVVMKWLLYAFTTPGVIETEVSMFGKNDKCRMDLMFKAGDVWIAADVKSSQDASDENFARHASRFGYALQESHYRAVSEEVGCPLYAFPFIVIETEAPYACNVFLSSDEFREIGDKKRAYAKKRLTEYNERGDNTAYTPAAKVLEPASWDNFGPWMD